MMRSFVGMVVAVSMLAGVPDTVTSPAAATTAEAGFSVAVQGVTMAQDDLDDEPIERRVSGLAKILVREVRWSLRMIVWMFWRAVDWWSNWAKRVAFSLAVAIIAALADGGLVNAWRAEGLRTLLTYSALMLYVYGRLLFSAGVSLAPKLLLIGALIYGVVRRDLVPDKTFLPGRVEDIVLIVIATRAFVYSCPEALVNEYAERAVNLKRRVVALQRVRPR